MGLYPVRPLLFACILQVLWALNKWGPEHPDCAGVVKNARAMRKLKEEAVKAKHFLSQNYRLAGFCAQTTLETSSTYAHSCRADMFIESLYNDEDFELSISRDEFEELNAELFTRSLFGLNLFFGFCNMCGLLLRR